MTPLFRCPECGRLGNEGHALHCLRMEHLRLMHLAHMLDTIFGAKPARVIKSRDESERA